MPSIAPSPPGRWQTAMYFHVGSLVLHAACGLLVFAVLMCLVRDGAAACCGALLFALHPLQTEAVAWVTETRGLLCWFFSLSAIVLR